MFLVLHFLQDNKTSTAFQLKMTYLLLINLLKFQLIKITFVSKNDTKPNTVKLLLSPNFTSVSINYQKKSHEADFWNFGCQCRNSMRENIDGEEITQQ